MAKEHLDVLIIGAGLSGIGAGHYIQTDCPWANYAIFEMRGAIGGTWDLFRYPGIRSDSDMFTLGYSFRPWQGAKSIADGDSILEYIQETARVEGIDQHIRFNHKILAADWSTADACWNIVAEANGERIELTAGFLFSCAGYYRYDQGHTPDFPGLADFTGQVIHPQHWPQDLDYTDKRVVVIGSGATAITLIPSMADKAAHVTMLQRSPTYVIALPAKNPMANFLRRVVPDKYAGDVVRWFNAMMTQGSYTLSRKQPGLVKRIIRAQAKANLPKDYPVDVHFKPKYNPWDQRLCVVPNGDLFKAIKHGDASIVTDEIDTFTATGIRTKSGEHLDADIVVTATGLEMLFIGGTAVTVNGEEVPISERLMYKGMMLEGVPNMALAFGYTNASWTLKCDLTCAYVGRLLNHMHATGHRQAVAMNLDPSVTTAPMLGLTSGYVTRAADKFPQQGTKFPWQVHQSYLADYRAMERSDLVDGTMQFSNPTPAGEKASASV